jgi:hypothetical protein
MYTHPHTDIHKYACTYITGNNEIVVEAAWNTQAHPESQHEAISKAMTRTNTLLRRIEGDIEAQDKFIHVDTHVEDEYADKSYDDLQHEVLHVGEGHLDSASGCQSVNVEPDDKRDQDSRHEGLMCDNVSMSYEETVNKLMEHVIKLHRSDSASLDTRHVEQQHLDGGSDANHEAHVSTDLGRHRGHDASPHTHSSATNAAEAHVRVDPREDLPFQDVEHDIAHVARMHGTHSHGDFHAHNDHDHDQGLSHESKQACAESETPISGINTVVPSVSVGDASCDVTQTPSTQPSVITYTTEALTRRPSRQPSSTSLQGLLNMQSHGDVISHVTHEDGHGVESHCDVSGNVSAAEQQQDEGEERHIATCDAVSHADSTAGHVGAAASHDVVNVMEDMHVHGDHTNVAHTDTLKQAMPMQGHAATDGDETDSYHVCNKATAAATSEDIRTDEHKNVNSGSAYEGPVSAGPSSKSESRIDSHVTQSSEALRDDSSSSPIKLASGFNMGKVCTAAMAAVPLAWWLVSSLVNQDTNNHINRLLDMLNGGKLEDQKLKTTVVARNVKSADTQHKDPNQRVDRALGSPRRSRNDKTVTASVKHMLSMVQVPMWVMGGATAAAVGGGAAVMSKAVCTSLSLHATTKLAGFVTRRTCTQEREHVSGHQGKLGNSSNEHFQSRSMPAHNVHAYLRGRGDNCEKDDGQGTTSSHAPLSSEGWLHVDDDLDSGDIYLYVCMFLLQ